MATEVDPKEFLEWKRGMHEDDFIHAFRAIKTVDNIKFALVTEPTDAAKLEKVEDIVHSWH